MNSREIANLVNKVRMIITPSLVSKARIDGSYTDPETGLYIEVFRSTGYTTMDEAEKKLRAVRSEFTEWGGWGEYSASITPSGKKYDMERVQFCVRKYCPARV